MFNIAWGARQYAPTVWEHVEWTPLLDQSSEAPNQVPKDRQPTHSLIPVRRKANGQRVLEPGDELHALHGRYQACPDGFGLIDDFLVLKKDGTLQFYVEPCKLNAQKILN